MRRPKAGSLRHFEERGIRVRPLTACRLPKAAGPAF